MKPLRLPGGREHFRVLGGPAHGTEQPLPEGEKVYRHPVSDGNGVVTETAVYRLVAVLKVEGGGLVEFLAEPHRDADDLVAMAREWVL